MTPFEPKRVHPGEFRGSRRNETVRNKQKEYRTSVA